MKIHPSLIWARGVLIAVFVIFSASMAGAQPAGEKPLYWDVSKSFEERARDLLQRMTLAEKLSQMMSRTPAAIDRLGIPPYNWSGEPGHAVMAKNGVATIFPQAIAQAATWDYDLILKVGSAISDEARARFHAGLSRAGVTFWSPVVEMARDPRWGRTQECYGEDPYLTSQLSMALVRGLQGDHPRYLKAIAAPKHYAANNEEWRRHSGSSEVDEQLLREYYLAPYKVLIEQAKAQSIMAAYNALNGVPCACNKTLLTDILRGEWGFEGSVVSDCNGINDLYQNHHYAATVEESIALAVNAGLDMECGDLFKVYLARTVEHGLISEATIDQAVYRLLLSRFRLGLYDPPDMVPYTKIPMSVVDSKENRELARQAARKAIVLLKNERNVLPLDGTKISTVAVIGPNATVCQLGAYTGNYSKAVAPLEGIQTRLGAQKVVYEKGCDIKLVLPAIPSAQLLPPGARDGEHGLKGEYFNNTTLSGKPVLVRVDPVLDFDWGRGSPDPSVHVDTFSVRWTGQFVAPVSGDYYFGAVFDDAVRLFFDGQVLINKPNNRNSTSDMKRLTLQAGKQYDLRVEFCEHWYKSKMQLCGAPVDPARFQPAVAAAKKADAAIVVLGTDGSVEAEGVDRSDLDLPGVQEELLKAVYQANPKTVLVLQNGSSLSIHWAKENIPAILTAWYPGEEGGHAIADVLFGDYNPAGRLPLTFYKSVQQLPPMDDYDIRRGRTYMAEIRQAGSYQAEKDEPLYPFGYGLSYTQFKYSNLQISPKSADNKGQVQVSVTVKNIGSRSGEDVVQLYVRDVQASVPRPILELKGFKRIALEPQESKTVTLTVAAADLAFWDVHQKMFVVEPGRFEVMVGASAADIRLKGGFDIVASVGK